jgi:hypothetical protein
MSVLEKRLEASTGGIAGGEFCHCSSFAPTTYHPPPVLVFE